MLIALLACFASPTPLAIPFAPRTPHDACQRLDAIGASCTGCDGGNLGDEVSYHCEGTLRGAAFTLDAVTTGMALPKPAQGTARMVDDLWVEVVVGADLAAAEGLLEDWAP